MRNHSTTDRLAARLGAVTIFGRRLADVRAEARRRRIPSHWTNLFGIVTLACIVVVTITGLWLLFFYTPSSDTTTYAGGYARTGGYAKAPTLNGLKWLEANSPGDDVFEWPCIATTIRCFSANGAMRLATSSVVELVMISAPSAAAISKPRSISASL